MKEKIKEKYRTFRHNINYKEDYYKDILALLLLLLILDLVILYIIWQVNNMKLWLVIKDTKSKRTWFKYFTKEWEMNEYLRKIKYIDNLLLIEDSRDIVYT